MYIPSNLSIALSIWPHRSSLNRKRSVHIIRLTTSSFDQLFTEESASSVSWIFSGGMLAFFILILMIFIIFCLMTRKLKNLIIIFVFFLKQRRFCIIMDFYLYQNL